MKNKLIDILKSPFSYLMLALSCLRIYLGWAVGIWFPAAQLWDDALLMGYSDIGMHFLKPARYSLLKHMGFPVFLKFSSVTKLPYTVVLSLLWIAAAVTVYAIIGKLFRKRYIPLAVFIYILFIPQAFEIWTGTRLYRNAIIDPFVIISLSLMINMIILAAENGKHRIVNAVFTGLIFSYTYYIKEDGIWLLACLIFSITVSLVYIIIDCVSKTGGKTNIIKGIAVSFIPVILFVITTVSYKAINYRYFGVFEINTRVDSEYGRFVKNVYRIESENRSLYVWTPTDAIQKAFKASPTLAGQKELHDAVMSTEWANGDAINNPIQCDHFNFLLREEMYKIGMYTSEADVKAFFKQVNDELDAAFADGTLKKQSGVFQIVASAGGYTWDEILSLGSLVKDAFQGAVVYKGYKLGLSNVGPEEIADNAASIEYAKAITHTDYLDDYSAKKIQSEKAVKLYSPILHVYRTINVIMAVLAILTVVFELVILLINIKTLKTFFKKRCKILLGTFGIIVFTGIALLYSFAIGWFSAFCFADGVNMTILNFYNISLPGLLMFVYIFTGFTIIEHLSLVINERGLHNERI